MVIPLGQYIPISVIFYWAINLIPPTLTPAILRDKLQKQLQLFYTYHWYKVMCKILCK